MTTSKAKCAFTLVELLVVIAIICVGLAIALPAYYASSGGDLKFVYNLPNDAQNIQVLNQRPPYQIQYSRTINDQQHLFIKDGDFTNEVR